MSNKPTNVYTHIDTFPDISSHSLIVKPIQVEEKPKLNKFKCSSSENNIKNINKAIKQKIVSKVKSWSSRDKYTVNENIEVEADLAESFRNLGITADTSDEIANSNLMRARDSLDNLKDENCKITDDSRCHSCSSAPESRERNPPESPKSSPLLSDTSKPSTSGDKSQLWEHFEKPTRRNRKEYKRKKKTAANMEQPKHENISMPIEGNSCLKKTPDEARAKSENDIDVTESEFPYKYSYFPKNSKSVVFTNEVYVVYFNGDEVVCESKEPLKKDVEQQVRNKEMRHGHLLKTQEKYNLCLF
ncbi:hypothetical protein NQ317_004916 [Molorchus minor]|uniref:Uncharacterized protein n=1 Tax=Molorchus minor TaxID=1323400 RepID=A0ABQ9JID9_9CUCU|nr:hypothetical protein NQ317_004916 [Molorchus minor]